MYALIIPVFSALWWKCTVVFLLSFVSLLLLAKTRCRDLIANGLGFYLFFDMFYLQWFRWSIGAWSANVALPLQFCNVMAIVASIALLTRWKWAYEFVLFLGVVAPLQALITPAFAFSDTVFMCTYYCTHAITVASPFFLMVSYGLRPRVHSWWKISSSFAFFLLPLATFNYFTDSNYMFLMKPPPMTHPFIFGDWPYYVLSWVLLLLVACFLLYVIIPREKHL